jgi:hypothetical protein
MSSPSERNQAQQFEQYLNADLGGAGGRVVLRRNFDQVSADDVEPLEAAEELQYHA